MDFEKLILGEQELHDFENLLLREKIIDSVQDDFDNLVDIDEAYNQAKSKRKNRKKNNDLLIFLMLYEKIDATNISIYNYSRFIDLGIVDSKSCLVNGTEKTYLTSKIIDSAWNYKRRIISILYKITDALFKANHINIFSKNLISEQHLLDLCDSYLYGTESDFLKEYIFLAREIWKRYITNVYSGNDFTPIYGYSLIDNSVLFERIEKILISEINNIYGELSKINKNQNDFIDYENLCRNLDACIQRYLVSDICMCCKNDWQKCCLNSEFIYNVSFDCQSREDLGSQRYAKMNGLILSSTEKATLFDNSLKFKNNNDRLDAFVDDLNVYVDKIYHIVNVDLSRMVNSLPVPNNIYEALRLRKRDEIVSLRNIYLEWSQCLYDGNINEAHYIQQSFNEAISFFEKRKIDSKRKQSILSCSFEAFGNELPYLSNITGIITPFMNRKKLREEERHKWFLLTR